MERFAGMPSFTKSSCRVVLSTLVFALLSIHSSVSASYSGAFLLNRPGARANSLGQTGVVSAQGSEGVFWNPASLSLLDDAEVSATYTSLPFELNRTSLAGKLTSHSRLNVGFGIQMLDYGEIGLRSGPTREIEGSANPYSLAVVLASSYRISRYFSAGIAVDYLSERLMDIDKTVALGFGVNYRRPTWELALSVSNLAARLWGYRIPRVLAIGGSYSIIEELCKTYASMDVSSVGTSGMGFGVEFRPLRTLGIRAGYRNGSAWSHSSVLNSGLQLGTSVAKGPLSFSYGYSNSSGIADFHNLSISYSVLARRSKPIYDYFDKDEKLIPIALLPITATESESSATWISPALGELLKTELSNSRYFRIVEVRDSPDNVKDRRRVLKQAGIMYAIGGSYLGAEDQYRFNANLISVDDMSILGGVPAVGRLSRLADIASELAKAIDEKLYYLSSPPDVALRYQPLTTLTVGDSSIASLLVDSLVNQIIPSQFLFLDTVCLGYAKVKNLSRARISDLRLSATIPGLGEISTVGHLSDLSPESTSVVRLLCSVSHSEILKNTDYREEELTLSLKGVLKRKDFQLTRRLPVLLHPLNQIDWQYPQSVSVFVDPNITNDIDASHLMPPDTLNQFGDLVLIMKVASCYQSLRIAYRRDPNVLDASRQLDIVQLPTATARLRSGDCDDQSVLLASLLTGVGVEARIAVTDNHTFCLANTGLHLKNRHRISNDSNDVVLYRNQVWIPIETTAMESGFLEAIRIGAEKLRQSRATAVFVDLQRSSSPYLEPISRIDRDSSLARQWSIDPNELYSNFFRNLDETISYLREIANERITMKLADSSVGGTTACDAIRDLVLLGTLDSAITVGRTLSSQYRNHAQLLNALGNCYLLADSLSQAENCYRSALSCDSALSSAIVNLGLLYMTAGLDSLAAIQFSSALDLLTTEELAALLGIEMGPFSGQKDASGKRPRRITREVVQYQVEVARVKNRTSRLAIKAPSSSTAISSDRHKTLPSAGRRGIDAVDHESLIDFLVW